MRGARSGTGWRWAVVAALVAPLVALPPLVGLWPAPDADVSAVELRDAVLAGDDVRFTGYAESAGGLLLPAGRRSLSRVVDLFSDRTPMRVWWRSDIDHRVDVVSAGGETGYYRDGGGGWVWEYEDNRATRFGPGLLALPTAPDLLPSSLGRRLLSEATDDELTRIGAERIAGRDALGLRITPAFGASSVDRVDVWVDEQTGLPLQVRLFARDGDLPALDTRFLDLAVAEPDVDVTRFIPPADARITRNQDQGVLERAGRTLSRVPLPDELAGLPRRALDGSPPAIGLYGRGVTLLAVVPVSEGLAMDLSRELRRTPDAVADELGLRIAAGPLGLAVLDPPGETAYVVTGTVTLEALADAATGLGLES